MRTIFEASSGLEAHMILNLLQQEGIECRVDGEYLQGGVGELQAMNIVRVLVEDSNYEKARTVIDEWDSTQIDNTDAHTPVKSGSNIGTGLLFGLIIGIVVTFWAFNSPITSDGIDYNNDGQLDEIWIYKDNRLSRVEVDRNRDGVTDVVNSYNRKGIIYKSETDDDFDGTYETTYKYHQGSLKSQESDTNQDGKIDLLAIFENDVLAEVQLTGPDINSPKKKQKYKMNKLIGADFDSNGDGIYDIFYEYDFYEEVKRISNKALNLDTKQRARSAN